MFALKVTNDYFPNDYLSSNEQWNGDLRIEGVFLQRAMTPYELAILVAL
jgi:hypothetical protein